jgi:hypothetical protein
MKYETRISMREPTGEVAGIVAFSGRLQLEQAAGFA